MSRRPTRRPAPHLRARPPLNPRRDNPEKTTAWAEKGFIVSIVDHDAPNGLSKIDLSVLKARSELASEICDYGAHWGPSVDVGTRTNLKKSIQYFASFLNTLEDTFGTKVNSIEDCTADIVDLFKNWLRGWVDINPPAALLTDTLSALTAARIYNDLGRAFKWILGRSDRAGRRKPNPFKRNPYPRASREVKHKTPLDAATLGKIRHACFAELDATIGLLRRGEQILATTQSANLSDLINIGYDDLDAAVALYAKLEDEGISHRTLVKRFPVSVRRLRSYSRTEIISHLHFTPRALVPIILLLAMESFYNAETIFDAVWNDVVFSDLANGRLKLSPGKGRGGFKQPREFSNLDLKRY